MLGTTLLSPTINGLARTSFRENRSAVPTTAVTGSRWLLRITVLSFVPQDAAPGYHDLDVSLARAGRFHVRARPGYWATEPK